MNRETSVIQSTLLRNKLGRLVKRLQQNSSPKGTAQYKTMEQVLNESVRILHLFYQNLSKPHFKPIEIFVDSEPNPNDYNDNFQMIYDDLTVIFKEFENIEGVVLGGFNYMVSKLNRLNRKMKGVSSLLGDYVLFSNLPTKDAIFFADSFGNLTRVEANSPLLSTVQCEVNQAEGIVTLPVSRSAQSSISISETPVINSNSNGYIGNNHELNAATNSDISKILDDNADTWFEYERVLLTDDTIPLVLDFTVNLGSAKIINFIRINPNNFGTRTQVNIVSIDTSFDGKSYLSIKDDIPIAGFTVEDEENIFSLAPSTSKYAGQGLYSFTPRKVKFIRFQLKQQTPYIIDTSLGERIRYAIGIRDIEVQAIPYETKGELISTEYSTQNEIRKVAIHSNQRPSAGSVSKLVSIRHFVSPDNGVTWHELRPLESEGIANVEQKIPEILDFNGPLTNSVKTNSSVYSLRYKVVMERFPDAFNNNAEELSDETADGTELHPVPNLAPFDLPLKRTPIKNSIKIIDPNLGSRGDKEAKYPVAKGTGGQMRVILPFWPIKRTISKDTTSLATGDIRYMVESNPLTVYVDGVPWEQSLNDGSGEAEASGSTDNHYSINFETGELQFGDGTIGKAVPTGAVVAVTLDEEKIFPSHDSEHLSSLDYPTANDKKAFKLEKVDPLTLRTDVLVPGVTRQQLAPRISSDYTVIFSDTSTTFQTIKTFIDGSSEFTPVAGEYSIDYDNGVVFSVTRTSTTSASTVSYKYEPRTIIKESDWDFKNIDGIANAISIKDSAFESFSSTKETVAYTTKYFGLLNDRVVRGTVKFTGTTSGYFDIEVPFVDGRTEFSSVVKTQEKLASITAGAGEIVIISFSIPVSTSTSYTVKFTNTTVFSSEKTVLGDVNTNGDYFIDRSNNRVHVQVSGNIEDPGYVIYYYDNANANPTGKYSINYKTGEVYTYTNTPGAGSPAYVQYKYTDYRATYTIAREVPSTDWELDLQNNKISIADREILKNSRLPQVVSATNATKRYQVIYKYIGKPREDIKGLERHFTPVLKDYGLKVITKDRLV